MNQPVGATPNSSLRHRILYLGHPESHVPGYELSENAAAPLSRGGLGVLAAIATVVAFAGFLLHHWAEGAAQPIVQPWLMAPFVLLLLSIATMPFIAKHWWEHNYARVAIALGVLVAGYYAFAIGTLGARTTASAVSEYISFIYLLGSLFVVSGGILIRVRATATPVANCTLLLIGAILANIFGTTGASMLLIRPFLRMNKGHIRPYHVVFFIFVVSNAGGCLTPIGDPPLFLGYLQGVPFWWVLEHCWPFWLLVCGGLIATFFVVDTIHARKLARQDFEGDAGPAVSVYGAGNLIWIVVIIAGILLHDPINHFLARAIRFELPVRELSMTLAAVASLATTPRRVHVENHFNYAPIKEVALLFVGIFLTMMPALNYLYHSSAPAQGEGQVAATSAEPLIHTPGQFYFASGSLSSVLDNAPTYLTFLQSKLGQLDQATVARAIEIAKRPGSEVTDADVVELSPENANALRSAIDALQRYHKERINSGSLNDGETRVGFLVGDPKLNLSLIAISMGSVLFGAMTYIGNGPNFMVKSVADHAGVETPSFFGYVFRYSIPILLPLLILGWAIWLR